MDEFPRYVLEYLIDNYCSEETFNEETESTVDKALECACAMCTGISFACIKDIVENWMAHPRPTLELSIPAVPLTDYDELLQVQEAAG